MFISGRRYFKDVRFPVYFEKNDGYAVVPYRNQRLIITFVKQGTAVLENGSRQYLVAAPAVLCINERTEVRLADQRDFAADSIYFDPSFINANLDFDRIRKANPDLTYSEQQDQYLFAPFGSRPDSLAVYPLLPHSRSECDTLFRKFDLAIHNTDEGYCPCWLRAVLMSLLIFLLECERTSGAAPGDEVPAAAAGIKDITLFLCTHYAEDLTVAGIAARFGTNRTTLNLRFNRVTGTSIMRFIRNLRLNVAARSLRTTEKSVTEIGLDTGFRDISNFCRLFREAYLCTPTDYRSMYGLAATPPAASAQPVLR